MTDTRSTPHPFPARRLRSRLAAGALSTLVAGAGLGLVSPAPAAAATTSVTIGGDGGETIQIDNLSRYSSANVATLAKKADNSMATQGTDSSARGQMNAGDRIVVTDAGLFWLDIKDRGGLLSGMWALKKTSSSSADFANYVKPGWSPNYLAPGSDGDALSRPFDNGQYLSVIPTGGFDGDCTAAEGTRKFVISRSFLCGLDHAPASTAPPVVSGSSYTFKGTLYEAGSGATTMKDAQGNAAMVNYALTYRFSSSVRSEIVLTPTAPINLTTVVLGGVSDYGTTPDKAKAYSVSNRDRVHFTDNGASCGPTRNVLAFEVAKLCVANGAAFENTNYVITNTDNYEDIGIKTNGVLRSGDYVTARQARDTSTAQRHLTYTVPNATGFRVPQSIDHVWNSGVKVVALDADFVNSKRVDTTSTTPFKGAIDITMTGR